MDRETTGKLDRYFSAFTEAAAFLLLLDYDGTLAPFRVDRLQAQPWAGVREVLSEIQNQARTRMVVVTGRPAAEILPLLGIDPAPEVWGLHGAERLFADGRHQFELPSPETRARLDALAAQLRCEAPAGLVEQKPNAVAMHWRGVPPEKAAEIEKQTRARFEPLVRTDGLMLLEFEAGLELRVGQDKGRAVNILLEETACAGSRIAAYLGDDMTDEAAFRAIEGHGLGVLVRENRRETAAGLWLRPPEELMEFLRRWRNAILSLKSC